ncbi:hypothetical protein O181_131409 [Austropuccinia psidii MF-1]|uniref:Uncharacterized protein n=1 Tax=Austropuccinia psidii MF-1 TaxID=1389203 RepID=A0A9Q3QB09_9BASI|nr:hypothetical protein [Austropuccinia psidii MF-1]
MSWFSHYSTDQILSQFLPCNQDLVQAPSQGTSAIGTGEESQIPPLTPYNPLPNCPLKSPNRPYLSFCITIIGLQVPPSMTPGSQLQPLQACHLWASTNPLFAPTVVLLISDKGTWGVDQQEYCYIYECNYCTYQINIARPNSSNLNKNQSACKGCHNA